MSTALVVVGLVLVALAALGGFVLGRRGRVEPLGEPTADEARIRVAADAKRAQILSTIDKPPVEKMSHAQKLDELNRRTRPRK